MNSRDHLERRFASKDNVYASSGTNKKKTLGVKLAKLVFFNFILKELKFSKISQHFLVPDPLVRKNCVGRRENKSHIFRA